MAPRCAHPVALIALLLFGLVALLLLTITTEDVREAPVFMVSELGLRRGILGVFG